ncbi:MAG: GNAT family N-acetyltransferase [Bacteroidota bacterium]
MNANMQIREAAVLPKGFSSRGAVLSDIEPAMQLFNRWSQSAIGRDEITDAEALQAEWRSPGFDPAQDIRLIFAPDGGLAGYVEVWTTASPPVHPWIWGRVDPACENLGLGTWLLQWAESRACDALERLEPDVRFTVRVGTYREAVRPRQLFEDQGYRYLRSSHDMRIEMEAPPPAPRWPDGIRLRTFNPQTDLEAVYRADLEAFRDHFGFVEPPYEEGLQRFRHFLVDRPGFDPGLWFLAMDGEEVAGISLCRSGTHDDPELGWVNDLAVRRPWRKRGLGLALLLHSFGEFHRRGNPKVGLGVDAENLTGALRLYEKAGMHVYSTFDRFEKEIRPGREISVQSLRP